MLDNSSGWLYCNNRCSSGAISSNLHEMREHLLEVGARVHCGRAIEAEASRTESNGNVSLGQCDPTLFFVSFCAV